jgi:cytochrome c-type biogenesis protein CcmH
MLIWIIFAAMTGAAVFALLWPLGRRSADVFAETADAKSLYRSQLAEIERDLGRGLLGGAEADAARTEAARRLLHAAEGEAHPEGESEPALRRRRAASALALSCVPLLALLLYGALGSPSHPDQPLAARLQQAPSQQDFELALARIETHLAANPSDGRGWAVIAPVYLRQGRFDDAARAFAAAIRHDGTSADRLAGLGEARTLAAGGVVTAEALQAFTDAVALDAKNPRARFFLAIAKEQDGNNDGAIAALRALLADAPPKAAWTAMVQQRLEGLAPGSTTGSAIASLPAADQQAAIRGMVDGLAERLRQGGGTLPEWVRLIRSQLVLGNRPAAVEAMATARQRLARDADAMAQLDALAGELNLREPQP